MVFLMGDGILDDDEVGMEISLTTGTYVGVFPARSWPFPGLAVKGRNWRRPNFAISGAQEGREA